MSKKITRRQMVSRIGAATGLGFSAGGIAACSFGAELKQRGQSKAPFRYCLNTSTIRGQKLTLVEEIEIAAKAGYQGIEPWVREIQAYVDQGGSLSDLKKRIADLGLIVESAIGFAQWIVDDDQRRAQGLETARRDMELVRAIGGSRIAAPPVGATNQTDLDLLKAAERYRDLLILGEEMKVTPQVELWGFSKSLSRLGEVLLVASESGHRNACLLPDVYHIYKGGSDFSGLKIIDGAAMHCFHINDYPNHPPRSTIRDADRVYPGDGVAPLRMILQDLRHTGFRGALSLELFNPNYWRQDPLKVAKTGLEKMRLVVEKSLA